MTVKFKDFNTVYMYVEKLLLNESLQYSPHSNFRELNKFLDAGIQGTFTKILWNQRLQIFLLHRNLSFHFEFFVKLIAPALLWKSFRQTNSILIFYQSIIISGYFRILEMIHILGPAPTVCKIKQFCIQSNLKNIS